MQDEGNVEQGQTAVHEDHLVDERRGELVSNLAEKGKVDQPQQSGTTPRHNAQVEPLTSGILRHFRQTPSSHQLYMYSLPSGESSLSALLSWNKYNWAENLTSGPHRHSLNLQLFKALIVKMYKNEQTVKFYFYYFVWL